MSNCILIRQFFFLTFFCLSEGPPVWTFSTLHSTIHCTAWYIQNVLDLEIKIIIEIWRAYYFKNIIFFSDLMPKLSKRKLVPGKGGIYHTRFLEQRQIDKVKMSSYLKCGVLRVLVVQNNKEMDWHIYSLFFQKKGKEKKQEAKLKE